MKRANRPQRNLLELLNTKYDDFNYSNWTAEFNVTASKMLPQGLETLGLFLYCENEHVMQASNRKVTQLLSKIRAVQRDDDLEDSDDEIGEALKQTIYSKSEDQFLVMTLFPKSKPVAHVSDGKSLNWANSEPVRNQPIFDQLIICDAQVPLDGLCSYLPTDDNAEDLIWFNKLATDLFQQLEAKMSDSVLKVNNEVMITPKKQSQTLKELQERVDDSKQIFTA